MATITISFYEEASNTVDSFDHSLSDADLKRIVDAGRTRFGTENPMTMTKDPVSKKVARRKLAKELVSKLIEQSLREETSIAIAAIPRIEAVDVVEQAEIQAAANTANTETLSSGV